MTRVEKYRIALKGTAKHLKTWISATELSEAAEISRQTAYAHLEALQHLVTIEQKVDRVHAKGQKVVLFRIAPNCRWVL